MASITRNHLYTVDLNKPLTRQSCGILLAEGDNNGDCFSFALMRDGVAVIPGGALSVTAYFIRDDGNTVFLTGESSNINRASVTLPQSCYIGEGRFSLAVKVAMGGVTTTIAVLDGYIKNTQSATLIDPGSVIPSLDELFAQIEAMEAATAAANDAAEAAITAANNAKEFIVTVTMPEYILDGDMSVITADKSYSQIRAAITAGKTPVVKLVRNNHVETTILYMDFFAPVSIMFREHVNAPNDYNVGSGMQLTFLSTGGITLSSATFRSVPDGGTDGQVLVHKGESTYEWRDPSAIAGVAPAIIPTATGSIVTITDGAARPAVEVISHIEPVETGTGEKGPNNPWTISGWNSVTAQRTGKNILPNGDAEKEGSFLLYATDKAFAGAKGREINVSFDLYSPDGSAVAIYAYQQSGLSISNGYDFVPGAGVYARYSFTTSIIKYGQTLNAGNIIFYSPSGAAVKVKNVQVEFGTTATGHEPYEGKTISATLPETVYGGKLDWGTGVLTVTHKKDTINAASSVYSVTDTLIIGTVSESDMVRNSRGNGLCDALPSSNTVFGVNTPWTSRGGNDTVAYFSLPTDRAGTTLETLNAYLAANPLTIVYPLASPYTIQLTPQQLDTLKGINNVWSDCGDTTLSYVADTQLYIDQRIAALLNN